MLEIVALIVIGFWGYQTSTRQFNKLIFCIGAPLIVAIVWGTFGSPAAPIPLNTVMKIVLEIIIFGLAALALYFSGHPILASLFAGVITINRILMLIWKQ